MNDIPMCDPCIFCMHDSEEGCGCDCFSRLFPDIRPCPGFRQVFPSMDLEYELMMEGRL